MATLLEPRLRTSNGTIEHDAQVAPVDDAQSRRETPVFLYLPFAVAVLFTFGRTPDDPLITLRYAANLLAGHGAVFNVGEHVQGFSSPLHLLISVGVAAAPGGTPLFLAKLISLGFGVLAVRAGGRLVRHCALPTWARRLGYLLIATSFILATSSANGLETSLAAWLTVVLVDRLVQGEGVSAPLVTGMVAGALALTRPESAILLAGLAGTALVLERAVGLVRRVQWVAGGVLALLTLGIAGLVYYGDALPNTYYAKNGALGASLGHGWHYLASSLEPSGLCALIEVAVFAAGVAVVFTRARRLSYAVVVVIAQALFVLKSGGDWMLGGRFLAPVIIPFIVVQVVAVAELGRHLRQTSPALRTGAIGAAILFAVVAVTGPYLSSAAPAWRSHGEIDDHSLIATGAYGEYSAFWARLPSLVDCVQPGGSVATTEVGNLGYERRDLSILDLRGLTDAAIAKQSPASSKHPWGVEDPEWSRPGSVAGRRLLRERPDEIVLLVKAGRYPASALGGAYQRLQKVVLPTGAHVAVYARADVPSRCGVATPGR